MLFFVVAAAVFVRDFDDVTVVLVVVVVVDPRNLHLKFGQNRVCNS